MTDVRTSTVMGLVLTLSCLLTACQDPNPDKASLKYSQELYDGCVPCHGENAEGNQDVGAPAIAGLERLRVAPQRMKRDAAVVVRGGVLRIQPQRFIKRR